MRGHLLILGMALLPPLISTAPAQASWTVAAPVEMLRLDKNGDAIATLNKRAKLPDCAKRGQLRLASDNPDFATIYIRMLAAYLAYQDVSLDIGGEPCRQREPKIGGIKVNG